MAIYRAGKDGDAMGKEVGHRPGKSRLREIAKQKAEEEITIGENPDIDPNDRRSAAFASKKYEQRIAEERRRLGLC